tara:strand:- start:84259 stop:85578 length:1320 start_codon:yes stop_codon:yes gene_type:complete
MTFDQLGLSAPLLRAVTDAGYSRPTAIQQQAIPAVLAGRDVMAAAQTGTGKTAAFVLPMLQRLQKQAPHKQTPGPVPSVRALILTPTRELAAQVGDSVALYAAQLSIRSAVLYGGVRIELQIARLRQGVDIVIATPGRLLDLHQRGELSLGSVEVLVLDEADRMLDLGFIDDLRRIFAGLPKRRQSLLFSATFAADIRSLARSILHRPLEVSVAAPNATAEGVEQLLHPVDKRDKPAALLQLIVENNWQQVLVFTRTRKGADRLTDTLQQAGIAVVAIHSDKNQSARQRALAAFKNGTVRVLVATDIAARGLDIVQLPQVVNCDLPDVAQDYVHRIGRAGRAGAAGKACSLVSADEIKQLQAIEQLIGRHIPRDYIDGYEPVHEVPPSAALRKPRQAAGQRRNRGTSANGKRRPTADGRGQRRAGPIGKRSTRRRPRTR